MLFLYCRNNHIIVSLHFVDVVYLNDWFPDVSCFALWVSWTQAPLACRVRCLVQTLHFSRKNRSCEFSRSCILPCLGRWGSWQDCASASPAHFSVGFFFLVCPVCRSHSASFWISFRGNCSICCCTFSVSLGGGEFRSLCLTEISLISEILRIFKNVTMCVLL